MLRGTVHALCRSLARRGDARGALGDALGGGESARAWWRWTNALDARGAGFATSSAGGDGDGGDGTDASQPVIGAESKDAWPERRRLWNKELNELRVQWRKEFEEAEAKERERLRLMQIKLEKEVAERRRLKAIRRAEALRLEAIRQEKDRKRIERLERLVDHKRQQKMFSNHLRAAAREEHLLRQSRNWVLREHLDARIDHELANPVEMW